MRVVLVGTHRPGGLEESLLPDFLPADCRSWGWHDWQDKKVNVCREPKRFRVPNPDESDFALRSTWLRTDRGWSQIEDKVQWNKLDSKCGPIAVWGHRGVFIFERLPKVSPPAFQIAAPVVMIPRGRPLHRIQPHSGSVNQNVTQGESYRSPFARDREWVTDSGHGQRRRRHRSEPVAGAERVAVSISLHRRGKAAPQYNAGRLQISGGIFSMTSRAPGTPPKSAPSAPATAGWGNSYVPPVSKAPYPTQHEPQAPPAPGRPRPAPGGRLRWRRSAGWPGSGWSRGGARTRCLF
jgi:hypothetical protein